MKRPTFSALIIARNEEAMLANCIATLRWCNQILVLDDGSTDDTAKIAEQSGAKVIAFRHNSFARKREELLKRAQTDWVFYIDADERVVPTLAKEMMVVAETQKADAMRYRRNNIYYGQLLKYGVWGSDFVTRACMRESITGWCGDIHESRNSPVP